MSRTSALTLLLACSAFACAEPAGPEDAASPGEVAQLRTGARLLDWYAGTAFDTVSFDDAPPRTVTRTLTSSSNPGPMGAGNWFGDDHSRFVAMTGDIHGSTMNPLLFWIGGSITPTREFREFPFLPSGGSDWALVSGGAPPAGIGETESHRSTDIGYCSETVPWTVPTGPNKGSGLADQVLTVLSRSLHKEFPADPLPDVPGFFYVNLRSQGDGVSNDEICFITHGYRLDEGAACEITAVAAGFCGTFFMVEDDERPDFNNVRFQLTDVRVALPFVNGACQDLFLFNEFVAPTATQIRDEIASTIQNGTADCPKSVGELLSEAFNDQLLVKETPLGSGGAFVPPPPGQECFMAGSQEAQDARCEERFPDRRARCEQRGSDLNKFCYWDIGADRVELLPTRIEVVLAEESPDVAADVDPSLALLRELYAEQDLDPLSFEQELCRLTVPDEPLYTQGSIEWTPAAWPVVLPPESDGECK